MAKTTKQIKEPKEKHSIAGLIKPFAVLDLETSGLNVNTDEIVTFAAIKLLPDLSINKLEFICKPSKPISAEASAVNGITNEQVSQKPSFSHYANDIKLFLEGCDIGGFNVANFDIKILDRQLTECGIKELFKDIRIYDAFKVYKEDSPRKLANAFKFYTGEDIKDAHTALGDVQSTLRVIEKQLELRQYENDFDTIIASLNEKKEQLQHISVINGKDTLNFGKHKGTTLEKAPKGYLKWIIDGDFPANVISKIKQYV